MQIDEKKMLSNTKAVIYLDIRDKNLSSVEKLKLIPKAQWGISLIDFVIWFAVIGVLLSVLYGIFGPSQSATQSQAILAELQTMQTGIRNAYNGQTTGYSQISVPEVIASHAYPTSLNATTTSLTSSFAGAVSITSDSTGQSFTISYAGVPSAVCEVIISKLASSGGWTAINAGSKTTEGQPLWSGTGSIPDKSAIDSACSGSNVPMAFTSN